MQTAGRLRFGMPCGRAVVDTLAALGLPAVVRGQAFPSRCPLAFAASPRHHADGSRPRRGDVSDPANAQAAA
jgi:hypothetical protein